MINPVNEKVPNSWVYNLDIWMNEFSKFIKSDLMF